jgi:hypothetical protein
MSSVRSPQAGPGSSGSCGLPGAAARAEARAAAQQALAICAGADRIAGEASEALGTDDERLFSLLEERERMLASLAGPLATLGPRHAADGLTLAASERAVDDADALVDQVCEALSASQRRTATLAMHVAVRVAELRAELRTVQRAGSAGLGYATFGGPRLVDRVR